MKKIMTLLAALAICLMLVISPSRAEINPKGKLDEQVLATAQKEWQIAEACTSADDEAMALAATERTFKLIQAAIVAAGGITNGDAEIEFVDVPTWANNAKFTAIGITDNGTYTANIRAGTLPEGVRSVEAIATGRPDANTTLIGTLAFVIGTQTATRAEIAFTSGGTREIVPGDLLTGNTGGATAVVESISALTSGTWAAGTAAGTFTLIGQVGTFQSETIKVTDKEGVITADGVSVGSDTTKYEMADAVTVTAHDASAAWSSAGGTAEATCEAKIDLEGAKFLVIIPTTCSANSKLLVKFF